MNKSQIKVGVVGCGHLGSYHAGKYSEIESVDLLAVCDVDFAKASKLASKFKAQAFSDFKHLKDLNLDCVSIATDTRTHYEVVKFFLENKIDVLVEKPITVTKKEAEDLVRIAEDHNVILQVGHIERFNPAITKLKNHLSNPWFFEVRRIAPFKGRGADVDVVLDLMIHDIDLILYLVGSPVLRLEAVGVPVLTGSVDIANVRIEFEGGAIANISTSRAAFSSERSFRIFQPNSYISLDLDAKRLKISEKSEGKSVFGVPNINQHEEKIDQRDALMDQITSFINCVRTRATPEVSGKDALLVMELIERIKESMRISAEKFGEIPQELKNAINC